MSASSLQFIQTTPDALIEQINESVKSLIEDFKNSFNPQSTDVLLTRTQTCEFLHIDSSTLWHWTNKGKVTAYGICNRRYYKKSELVDSLKPLKRARNDR
jgi:malate synthase